MTALSKIPRTNVSVADIRDTLNANGGSVTNVLGTFFSSAANINIWARQKPIHWNSNTSNNDGAGDGNYGFTPARSLTLDGVKSLYDGNLNGWTVNFPSGGSSSPYRLGDFRNYNPKARESALSVTTEIISTLEVFVKEPIVEATDRSTLLLTDLNVVKNNYFGIALYRKDDGTRVYYQTATSKGVMKVTMQTTFMTIEYNMMPFLSSVPYTLNETFKTATYYSIPIGGLTLVTASTAASRYKLSIRATKLGAKITYTVTSSEASITRKDVLVYCRYQSSPQGSTIVSGETYTKITSIAPGGSYKGHFTVNSIKSYRLDMYCDTLYLKSAYPKEEVIEQ